MLAVNLMVISSKADRDFTCLTIMHVTIFSHFDNMYFYPTRIVFYNPLKEKIG